MGDKDGMWQCPKCETWNVSYRQVCRECKLGIRPKEK